MPSGRLIRGHDIACDLFHGFCFFPSCCIPYIYPRHPCQNFRIYLRLIFNSCFLPVFILVHKARSEQRAVSTSIFLLNPPEILSTMPMITADKDLPKLLDTPAKQVKWTKKLVSEHLGSASKRIDKPPMQGLFSRTLFVTLADGREVVVQFRTERLDLEAFKTAQGRPGRVCPRRRGSRQRGPGERRRLGVLPRPHARQDVAARRRRQGGPRGASPSTSRWAASFRRATSPM